MESIQTTKETTAVDLGDLLDAGDDAVVMLVAGETRLVVHRAVLVDRSPVFNAMFAHDMLEASSGQVDIADVEGPVLRQLVSYLYTLQASQLSGMAGHLLAAADKYGVASLKAACEQQVAAQLSVETAAAAAVLAVRHSCESLRQDAINFIKANLQVMATQGWADAFHNHPKEVFEVTRLLADPPAEGRITTMEAIPQTNETTAVDLGDLLDAGDDAVVTLVAGETRLVAHRAVLMDRSPVFAAMFTHDALEAGRGQVDIADVEGPVLRQLVSYLYTLQAPQLPGMATLLLEAADKYGVAGVKAACEQQVAAQLSVETAAAAAVLAVRHSCQSLRKDAINFIKANLQVMATQGWADAVINQSRDVVEVSRLLADPPAENSASAPAHSGTSHQPHSGDSRRSGAPATAAAASHHIPPPKETVVSHLRSLPAEERNRMLREAAEEGAVGELEALLNAGADVAAGDGSMWTALHCAAAGGQVDAAWRLLARGAPVDARSSEQRTPLHLAARCGHVEVARLLLAASADRSARDWWGRTPLDDARRNNQQQVVDLLSAR